jgi:hypothetical protein
MDLDFGWHTAVLSCAALVTGPIIVGLLMANLNRAANRTLGMMLLVLAGVIAPWMIGFAGFYDR